MDYLLHHPGSDVNIVEFDKECGVGVVVTAEEIKDAVSVFCCILSNLLCVIIVLIADLVINVFATRCLYGPGLGQGIKSKRTRLNRAAGLQVKLYPKFAYKTSNYEEVMYAMVYDGV